MDFFECCDSTFPVQTKDLVDLLGTKILVAQLSRTRVHSTFELLLSMHMFVLTPPKREVEHEI
jgi:hypothetical protein